MVDFTSILSKKPEETSEPKPRPTGTYLGAVSALPEQRTVETKDGERAVIRFKVKAMMPREDVDQEKLAESGEMPSWPPFNHDIWVDTPEGEWQFRQFLESVLGLDVKKKSYGELIPECIGKQLLFTVIHKMGMKDNVPTIYVNIGSVAKA